MSNFKYHIMIAQERRISTPENQRKLATVIEDTTVTPNGKTVNGMPQYDVTENPDQLYALNSGIDWQPDKNTVYDANILMVERLHESGNWIECIYGDNSQCKGHYLAWPYYRSEQEYIDGEEAKRVAAEASALARQKAEDELRLAAEEAAKNSTMTDFIGNQQV